MAIKQLSVFVENKEGALVEVTETLAKNQIDLKALSIADTQDYGILRVIVNDIDKAKQALEENGNIVKATDVVGFAVTDETGSMSKVISILSKNGINIEYLYAFISVLRKNAYVVARVKDNDKAEPQSGDVYKTDLMQNGTATAEFEGTLYKESGNVNKKRGNLCNCNRKTWQTIVARKLVLCYNLKLEMEV